MFKFLCVIVCLLFFSPLVMASDCDLKEGHIGRVSEVIDGDTIILASGKQVRLVGIQAPKLSLGRKNFKTWPLADDAKTRLETLVLNKKIKLKYGGRKKDRHGRLLAHVFTGSVWAQGSMISTGHARVYSFSDNRSCIDHLLALEAKARAEKLAIWNLPFYKVRKAKEIEVLASHHNMFQIVRGRVLSVGEAKGKTYLNFGINWKIDFTGVIKKRDLRYFRNHVLKPKDLVGKEVLVRGWLGFHNGPKIDISHPEQIQVMGQ